MPAYFHGGKPGLHPGDLLVPAPPHVVDDGCPVCVARRDGRACTVGEFRHWLHQFGPRAARALRELEGQPDDAPIDPPSAKQAVYITTSQAYATWYAARSQGDLYQVAPIGEVERSLEDHFSSWTTPVATVIRVLRRDVRLTRTERRTIMRQWKKADQRAARSLEARAG